MNLHKIDTYFIQQSFMKATKLLEILTWLTQYHATNIMFLVFCALLLYFFTFLLPCCDVRYDFRITTMFGSSLPPVVCRRAHVLFTSSVFICAQWCPTHIVLCFCVVCVRLESCAPYVNFFLDFPFLITPSVFSNVYLPFCLSDNSIL